MYTNFILFFFFSFRDANRPPGKVKIFLMERLLIARNEETKKKNNLEFGTLKSFFSTKRVFFSIGPCTPLGMDRNISIFVCVYVFIFFWLSIFTWGFAPKLSRYPHIPERSGNYIFFFLCGM